MPTPFSPVSMSGNFDFPPASTSPWGPQITRSRSRTAQNRPVAHPREGSSIRQVPSTSLENQRRLLEAHLQETEAELNHRSTRFHASAANTTYVPPSVHRSGTRQAVASLLSSSSQRSRGNRILRGGSQMQEAVNRLNQASSNISAALDPPSPRLRSDATALEDPGGVPVNEVEGDRQRAKRRKLNNGLLAKEFGLNYGYRGQVVPGPLRMEIVFCDGGLHEYGKDKYRPENVLRNDLSVYCTRSSKCDLVLRHEGGAPFCLQRLVVKAPETGFTAPIQEGMVFVAMDLEGLILKASRYTIRQSTSPSPSSFPSPSSSTQSPDLPSNYYLDSTPQGDHEQVRPPSRRRAEDGAHRFIPPPISSNSNDVWHGPASQTRNSSLQDTASSNTRPVQSHFNVSIDCDNHSDDDEEESSEATLADRHHRDRIPSSHYSSDEMDDPDFANYVLSAGTRRLQAPGNRRHRRRTAPRIIGIDELSAAEEGSQAKEGGDVLVPHAAIFIEKEKSMVSVKFEPIVSGRYILLKLWSPAKDQNIDIQSIIAHGFAGPRYFPASEFM